MRIDDLNRAPVSTGTQAGEKSGAADRAHGASKDSAGSGLEGTGGSEGADRADVSILAHSLAAPDAQRMEQLRLQVESGTYEVSAQSVANALIEAHLETRS